MGYVVIIGQFFLSLSILIVLHEMGHFFPAKWFNTRVEKFYLFFDAGFSLFKYKVGETEYGIGWLPLGGYVKIAGMIDESMDLEQMKQEPQPWEFRSKPAWQRMIIMLGGVTVNFILGFFLFGMVLWTWGEEYLPAKNVTYGIYADSLGMDLGLQDGDHILAIDDKVFEKFNDRVILREIVINDAKIITVKRNGAEQKLPVDPKFVEILSSHANKGKNLFIARTPFVAAALVKESPAEKAGIQVNDKIISYNGVSTPYFTDFYLKSKRNPNAEVVVGIIRNEKDTLSLSMTSSERGTIGVYPFGPTHFFDTQRQDYTFAEAMPAGTIKGYNFLADQIKAFGQMFKGKIKVTESLGGFGAIAGLFSTTWEWESFWRVTAILSLILGFMNLLPIPALDGGHVMFLLWEIITGRKPSDKFLEYATIAGFAFIIGLVIFANGLDVWRMIKGWLG